jgi:hypothetical protein
MDKKRSKHVAGIGLRQRAYHIAKTATGDVIDWRKVFVKPACQGSAIGRAAPTAQVACAMLTAGSQYAESAG